jgi:hypothetical protein
MQLLAVACRSTLLLLLGRTGRTVRRRGLCGYLHWLDCERLFGVKIPADTIVNAFARQPVGLPIHLLSQTLFVII